MALRQRQALDRAIIEPPRQPVLNSPSAILEPAPLSQSAQEAQSILEMMAQVFSLGMATFRPTGLPSPSISKRPETAAGRDAIITVAANGAITTFDQAAEEIFDYQPSAAIGKHVGILFGAAASPWFAAPPGGDFTRLSFEAPIEALGKRRDATIFAAEVSGTAIEMGGARRLVLVMRDMTAPDRAEAQRRTAEARFRSLVEQIPAVTFMGSLYEDKNEFYVSPQIEHLLGFSQEEWLSDPFLWFNQLHPEDRAYCNQEFARGCVTGGPFRAEFRALTRAGKVVWVHGEARVVADEDGRPLFIQGVAYDITESKRAEEAVRASADQLKASLAEKEVLLKEIHHRVKNNLQVISSLLRLQATHIEDARALEMFNESRNRIESMALVHEKLYQSANLSQVDFCEYTRSLSALLIASYGARTAQISLRTDMDDVSLSVDLALPLGLIINELLSNSLKYAFPGGAGGAIRIELHHLEDGRLQVIVADNGAGFPQHIDFRKTSTLGMQLVRALIEQIEGTIDMHRDGGTEFRISFRP